jgi:hypothetical protein
MPGAVFFTEAAMLARRIGNPDYGSDTVWNVVINAVLGVLVIVLVARTTRQRAVALAAALPLAVVGFTAYSLAGFG